MAVKTEPYKVTFDAGVCSIQSCKLVSFGIEYKVILTTTDPQVLALGAVASDLLMDVTVEVKARWRAGDLPMSPAPLMEPRPAGDPVDIAAPAR
jgi:hypothetical protein